MCSARYRPCPTRTNSLSRLWIDERRHVDEREHVAARRARARISSRDRGRTGVAPKRSTRPHQSTTRADRRPRGRGPSAIVPLPQCRLDVRRVDLLDVRGHARGIVVGAGEPGEAVQEHERRHALGMRRRGHHGHLRRVARARRASPVCEPSASMTATRSSTHHSIGGIPDDGRGHADPAHVEPEHAREARERRAGTPRTAAARTSASRWLPQSRTRTMSTRRPRRTRGRRCRRRPSARTACRVERQRELRDCRGEPARARSPRTAT